jgi:hypothetical protein
MLAAALLGVAALAPPALALVFEKVERECPIDGAKFESALMPSGTVFCVRLDLNRVCRMADPPPLRAEGLVVPDEPVQPPALPGTSAREAALRAGAPSRPAAARALPLGGRAVSRGGSTTR